MPDPVRVFVSHHHSSEENTFTTRLVADLKAAGADVWVDDEGITSGDFVRKIGEGLAGRQWLVLVMTPASVRSPWVQTEVGVALNEMTAGRMMGVIPVVMEKTAELDIPIIWRPLHRYDAVHDYVTARDGLLRALGLSSPIPDQRQPSVPPVTPPPPRGSSSASPFTLLPTQPEPQNLTASVTASPMKHGPTPRDRRFTWEYCEIKFDRGTNDQGTNDQGTIARLLDHRFYGEVTGPAGTRREGARSLPFHTIFNPPQQTPVNQELIDELVRDLISRGWEHLRERGPQWYSHKFRRQVK